MIEKIAENAEAIISILALISGLLGGKFLSDRGKAALVKELEEAKAATVKAAKTAAPVLDLAFNVGIGKIPLDENTLKKLSAGASVAWVDTKKLSEEVKDVLDEFAVARGVVKP